MSNLPTITEINAKSSKNPIQFAHVVNIQIKKISWTYSTQDWKRKLTCRVLGGERRRLREEQLLFHRRRRQIDHQLRRGTDRRGLFFLDGFRFRNLDRFRRIRLRGCRSCHWDRLLRFCFLSFGFSFLPERKFMSIQYKPINVFKQKCDEIIKSIFDSFSKFSL